MNSISKNVHIELNHIVNRYNNTYHRTIKMKPVNLNSSLCIVFNKAINDTDIRKMKKNAKTYVPNCSEEFFVITKVENIVPWIDKN